MSPALTISSRSSSSRFPGTSRIATGGRPFAFSFVVQRDQALPGAAVLAGVDVLPGQVVDRGDRRGARTGHDHLADVGAGGIGEVHDRLQLRPDDDLGHHAVDLALRQRRGQQVAWQRHEDDADLRRVRRLELLVQLLLERLPQLVGRASLHAVVHEVERAIEGGAHADEPALRHLVEVAGEPLVQVRPHTLRQRGLVRGRRQWRVRGVGRRGGGWAASAGAFAGLPPHPLAAHARLTSANAPSHVREQRGGGRRGRSQRSKPH